MKGKGKNRAGIGLSHPSAEGKGARIGYGDKDGRPALPYASLVLGVNSWSLRPWASACKSGKRLHL